MASRKDYYDILGVRRGASEEEIERAYRKLTRTYRSGRYSTNKIAESSLKEIAEAYEILSNREKKERYDRLGPELTAEVSSWEYGAEEEEDSNLEGFEDFFDYYSGGEGKSAVQQPQKGRDIFYPLVIKLDEADQGTEKKIQILREISCPRCATKGADPSGPQKICPKCGGAGRVQIGLPPAAYSQICSLCQGGGTILTRVCSSCAGKGKVVKKEIFPLRLPPGVGDGCQMYLKEKGHSGRYGGPAGDFIAQIKVRKHPYFHRKEDDLYLEVLLTVWEAVMGTKIKIPTLDGFTNLDVPPGVQNGDQIRLSGKGVSRLYGDGRGDQVVFFKVLVPRQLDAHSKEMVAELQRRAPGNPRQQSGWRFKRPGKRTNF